MTTGLSKSPDRISGMFNAIASRYDFLNHFLSVGIDRRWRRTAIRALCLTGEERVLDLCTGTADLAIAARHAAVPAARVVGLDFAHAMLQIGASKVARLKLTDSIQLIRGDATHIPLADASVDAITIGFGIRNVEHTARACAEMCRVLVSGGRLVMLEFAVPRAPLVRQAYLWYFNRVLPRIGRLLSHHEAAYAYLPASVSGFQMPEELSRLLESCGFADVRSGPLSFGIVYLYSAVKRPV